MFFREKFKLVEYIQFAKLTGHLLCCVMRKEWIRHGNHSINNTNINKILQ